MFLVAGLGNPGEQYAATPHNLGFLVVDRLAARHEIRVTRKECQALIGQGNIGGKTVLLAKPQTFMNLSGVAIKPLMEKNEVSPSDLLLVYDELDLPWGTLRVRPKGSPAGHNGVTDVIAKTRNAGVSANPAGSASRPSARKRSGLSAVAFYAAANRRTGCVRRPCGRRSGIHNCRRRRKVHGEIQSSRPRLHNRGRMRIYENLFIVKPDATEEEIDHLVDQMSEECHHRRWHD